jgi:hypothetical protein
VEVGAMRAGVSDEHSEEDDPREGMGALVWAFAGVIFCIVLSIGFATGAVSCHKRGAAPVHVEGADE